MLTKCSGLLCYSIILEQYFLFSATEGLWEFRLETPWGMSKERSTE
jgi:hypothetical protein